MRLPFAASIAATCILVVSGCPKSSTATSSAGTTSVSNAQVVKLARVLRAEDRRIVDDDFRALLQDADASIRAKAVLALGQIGDRAVVPDLAKAATDPAAEVRANAAFSLGIIAEPSSEVIVERLAADPTPAVRGAAAEALGRLHEPSGVPAILALLGDADMPVRASSACSAWKFAEPEPLLDALIAGLSVADGGVRTASSYALARLGAAPFAAASSGAVVGRLSESGVDRARTALVGRVSDPDAEVRMHAARGLASPRNGAELAAVGTLSKDAVAGVRVNALRSLGYPGISVMPYLDKGISDRDQGVARAALEAVGAAGGAAAAASLNRIIGKLANGWLREAAFLSLAKADPSITAAVVEGFLKNPDVRMRGAAAELIAGHQEPGAIEAAGTLLADTTPEVQALGVPIVASQGGAISKLLGKLMKSPDPIVRAAIGDAIGERFVKPQRDVESVDDLFSLSEDVWAASATDSLPDARLSVVDAVAKAGKDDRTRAALTIALGDVDVIVRRRAAERFKDVFGEDRSREIGPSSNRPLADYERIVRWSSVPHAAIVSLQRPGTSVGRFTLALDSDAAPMAVWNFAQLADKAFFDGATVHRVVPNFVVQDGDPRGDGNGGPGYSIRDEFNPLRFAAGVLGMASSGKDTAGSQWFVTLSPQPHLDGRYTSFGRVVRGFREIVTQIRPGDTIVSIRVYEGNGSEPLPAN